MPPPPTPSPTAPARSTIQVANVPPPSPPRPALSQRQSATSSEPPTSPDQASPGLPPTGLRQPPPPRTMSEAPDGMYVEVDDLVRLRGSGRLAVVDRVAGDTSSDDDSLHDAAAAATSASDDDDESFTDERGRLTRWVQGIPGVSARSDERRRDADGRHLISAYDDDIAAEDDADDPDELPALDGPRPDPQHPAHRELPDGHVLVLIAATGDKVVHPTKDLEPLDRNFEPGQIVSWAPDAGSQPSGDAVLQQSGIVEAVRKTVIVRRVTDVSPFTAEFPDSDTCFEVPSDHLGFFSGIRAGDPVVRGSCVGVIDYFQEDVYVQFSDGAIACIAGHRKALQNVDKRTPDRARPDPFSEGLYYPGQRVRSLPEVWKSIATWIRGSYSGEDEGVVKSVSVGDVGVEWVAKSFYSDGNEESPLISGENRIEVVAFSEISLLEAFRNLWWSVGDRGFLLDSDGARKGAVGDDVVDAKHARVNTLLTLSTVDDDDDGEWEEDVAFDQSSSGLSASPDAPPRHSNKSRLKRQGGRLMRAQRKARERGGVADQAGAVSDATLTNSSANPEDVVQVIGTRSRVDVLWQDGTRSQDALSLNFRINNHPDPYDFWPGDIVTKVDDDPGDLNRDETGGKAATVSERRKGALVGVNQGERTAIVKWQKEPNSEFEIEELVSVYEIKSDESDVGIGDTVLRVPNTEASDHRVKEWVGVVTKQSMGSCTVAWNGGTFSTLPIRELVYISGGDDASYDETGASTTDAESELVTPDTTVGFRMRAVLSHVPHDSEYLTWETDDYHPNWGTDDEGDTGQERADWNGVYGKTIISDALMAANIYSFREDIDIREARSALESIVVRMTDELGKKRYSPDGSVRRRRMSRMEERKLAGSMAYLLLGDMLSRTWARTYEQNGRHPRQFPMPFDEWKIFVESVMEAYADLMKREKEWLCEQGLLPDDHGEGTKAVSGREERSLVRSEDENGANGAMELVNGDVDNTVLVGEEDLVRFQVVEELKGFNAFPDISSRSTPSPGFLSVVRKEWNRLRKNLPPGVIIRACESKLHRLRAGVIGPQDTPYADVMFFFDIMLGPTYPMSPPHVWFHSQGHRINPNLYESGKVCLSILGTWDGDDVESWDAKTSNLLRILLSLQALVFVEEPYYNEAGYSRQRGTQEGRINSRMYNESAYLLCMRYILQTFRKGGVPEDCAEVARAHYRRAGPRILERCRRLSQGDVTMLTDANAIGANGAPENHQPHSSAGFRKSLNQLLKPLETVLLIGQMQSTA